MILVAGGARILLPEEIARPLREGHELGLVMEEYTQQKDVRKRGGAIGVFTNGYVNRSDMFTHITKMLIGQYMQQASEKK
ncbi:non-canonical (house-cleaning) NTP pyrophosphatase [Bacillus fengqiuensis]|nr:non-canonical (house-cleaning) NTP pyrophosphatase [Bacillus fengqiuensis]